MKIKSGKGTLIPLITVIDVYLIYIVNCFPGVAVSPLIGDMNKVFPHAPDIVIQMLITIPSLLCIPFIVVGGKLCAKYNNLWLLTIGNIVCFVSGLGMLFTDKLWMLIVLSATLGAGSGVMLPLAQGYIAQLFSGTERTKQYGYLSSVSTIAMIGATIGVGYVGEFNWRLPFAIYLLPIIPILLTPFLKKYVVVKPQKVDNTGPKENVYTHIKVPQLIKFMIFTGTLGFLTIVVNIDLPFLMEQYHYKSGLTGDVISFGMVAVAIAGFILKPVLGFLKASVYEMCMFAIGVGFFAIALSHNVWVFAIAIFVQAFFTGIANPFVIDKASKAASTTQALTIVMMWMLLVINIVAVASPYVIDGIKILFHNHNHTFSFWMNGTLGFIAGFVILIRRLILKARHKHLKVVVQGAGGATVTVPADSVAPAASATPTAPVTPTASATSPASAEKSSSAGSNAAATDSSSAAPDNTRTAPDSSATSENSATPK